MSERTDEGAASDPTSVPTTRTLTVDVGPSVGDDGSVQLWFLGVRHAAQSFEVRLFLDKPDADATTSVDDPSFAGSWSMYGHGTAAHLPVHPDPRSTPAGGGPVTLQGLEPFDTVVDLTAALCRLGLAGEVAVTLVPVSPEGITVPIEAALPERLRIRRD